jgi:hypothetical protein
MTKALTGLCFLVLGCAARSATQVSAPPAVAPVSPPSDATTAASPKELVPKDVWLVVQEAAPTIRACYELEGHNAEGRVTVRWGIGARGFATQVQIENTTLQNPPLESCLKATIRTLTFPTSFSDLVVSVPFVFRQAAPGEPEPRVR